MLTLADEVIDPSALQLNDIFSVPCDLGTFHIRSTKV